MLDDFHSGAMDVNSPDYTNRVTLAKDFSFKILKAGEEIGRIDLQDLSSNVQILWVPDSQKFSITYNSGGAMGTFRTHVYRIEREAVIELLKPLKTAFDDFKKQYYCKARGNNISALGWQTDSQAILLHTEVYPTSDGEDTWELSRLHHKTRVSRAALPPVALFILMKPEPESRLPASLCSAFFSARSSRSWPAPSSRAPSSHTMAQGERPACAVCPRLRWRWCNSQACNVS
jgi:hypothetical protein